MTTRTLESWRQDAACRDLDPNLFFPATDEQAVPAKAVCASCPVRDDCLEYAITTRQDDGVWGGLDEAERKRLRRRRQQVVRATRAA